MPSLADLALSTTTADESWFQCNHGADQISLVTILFFLWGFAYGLLDVLNSHFQSSLNISSSMAAGLSSAYFGAYFICPPTISGWILRKTGFRVTFMIGKSSKSVFWDKPFRGIVNSIWGRRNIADKHCLCRSCCSDRWMSSFLAQRYQGVFRRLLRVHVRCRSWSLYSRDCC